MKELVLKYLVRSTLLHSVLLFGSFFILLFLIPVFQVSGHSNSFRVSTNSYWIGIDIIMFFTVLCCS